MLEDVARTVHIAASSASRSASTQADIDALYDRYQNVYGQQGDLPVTDRQIWFLTGSQGLYGEDVLDPGRGPVAPGLRRPGRPRRHRRRRRRQAGADRRRRDPPGDARRQRRRPVRRRHRLDAHVLAGEDVDQRARRAAQAAAAPAHPGQQRAALGDDRHGLHEPQPGRPRRPRVRLHPDPDGPAAQDGRRPRQRPRGAPAGRPSGHGLPPPPRSLRTMRLARFGDNMRDVAVTEGDKVEAELRFGVSVNTYGVNDLVAVVDAVDDATSTRSSPSTRTSTTSPPSCGAAASATSRCATARASRSACATSSRTAASRRSPPTSRTSAGCGSCPASPSSA